MSVSREEFADQQATLRERTDMAKKAHMDDQRKEKTVENLIGKMLKKSVAVQIKQNASFTKAVRKMGQSDTMGKGDISKDVKAIVDKIGSVQAGTSKTNTISDSRNLQTRLNLISKMVEENDNVKGNELNQIRDMISMVDDQIKTERKVRHGLAKDIGKNVAENLPDTASLIAGVTGNSPALMFMTKIMGDFIKDKFKKRREALTENQDVLAEQLNVHQENAYNQREEYLKSIRDLKQNIRDENKAIENGDITKKEPKLKQIEYHETVEAPLLVKAEPSESESVSPIVNNPPSESGSLDISPMVEEQQQTNKILDTYISSLMRGAMDDTEQRRESETRQNKLFSLLSKRKGSKLEKIKGKGFWGKLFGSLPSLLGLTGLSATFAGISTFVTTTAIPAIIGFMSSVAGLIAPILAGVALLTVVTKMFTNFFNAGDALGKDSADVTILDRVASMIGGIMEGFASVADFIAGLFGFDTKLQEWWNINFTRPLAEFFDNFSLSKMWDGLIDFAMKIPKLMFEYSPIGLLMKGLTKLKEMFNLEPIFQPITDTFDSIMSVFATIKDFILASLEKLIGFIWEYSPFGIIAKGIGMITDYLDFAAIFKKVKAMIDGIIPDFLKGDSDQKKANDAYVTETLTKKGIVDYDTIGDSEIKDWDALAELEPANIQKIIDFGDFDDEDVERMKSLKQAGLDKEYAQNIREGKSLSVGYDAIPKDKLHLNPYAPANKAIMDERIKHNKLQIAGMEKQPVLSYRAEQAENIERSVKIIDEKKSKERQPIITPASASPSTTNQHTTINQPSTPFNNDRGINSLQAVFMP